MKESETIRYILHCFRAFGFYPFDIRSDFSHSLHLKRNTGWYIYSVLVTLITLSNVIQVTVQPYWDISEFHGLVSYSRLIMVSLDAVICYTETLVNVRWHIDFFETIARLETVLGKFQLVASCRRFGFWIPVSALLLASLNIIPQSVYIYDLWLNNPKIHSFITLQFEIPNLLASVKSLQIIFYAFLIFTLFDALENVRNSYGSCPHLSLNEFNQYHDLITNLIDIFNKCFGWSIIVNVTRDFIFFGEGSYLMIFSLRSLTQGILVILMWSHIVYCVLLCWLCHLIHRRATVLRVTGLCIENKINKSSRIRTLFSNFSSLKALHNYGYVFNALGCFVIDLKLLFGFFVFLTNYLLICVQFNMAGESDHFALFTNQHD